VTALLIPGLTCAQVLPASRSGVLVDGQDFYRAVYDACCKAERSIVMTGWQFESKVDLRRGCDADGCAHPVRFVDLMRDLCKARPELEIHILAWDASAIFTFEREPLQWLMFHVKGHRRVHYKMDNAHPFGASHHQKLIAIDRSIAFVGGMDICNARWDDRTHAAVQPERCSRGRTYGPYHDVQAYVTGEAVDVLRGWFRDRWRHATGKDMPEVDLPRREIDIQSTFDIDARCIGLTRTSPRTSVPPAAPITELYELHLRAIALAERLIYIENQYFSSDELCARPATTSASTTASRPAPRVTCRSSSTRRSWPSTIASCSSARQTPPIAAWGSIPSSVSPGKRRNPTTRCARRVWICSPNTAAENAPTSSV
jgi:phospholipase D1/2